MWYWKEYMFENFADSHNVICLWSFSNLCLYRTATYWSCVQACHYKCACLRAYLKTLFSKMLSVFSKVLCKVACIWVWSVLFHRTQNISVWFGSHVWRDFRGKDKTVPKSNIVPMLWFITQELYDVLKFNLHFWVPWNVIYKMHMREWVNVKKWVVSIGYPPHCVP